MATQFDWKVVFPTDFPTDDVSKTEGSYGDRKSSIIPSIRYTLKLLRDELLAAGYNVTDVAPLGARDGDATEKCDIRYFRVTLNTRTYIEIRVEFW